MCSIRTSLFFRLRPKPTPSQPAKLEARIPAVNAPAFFTTWRRVLFLVILLVSAAVSKNEIHQVSEVLLGQPFLQSLWHEREFGGLHLGDLRAGDDGLDAEGLTNSDAGGRLVHDQAGVAISVPGF